MSDTSPTKSGSAVGRPSSAWERVARSLAGILVARLAIILLLLAAWEYLPGPRTQFFLSRPSLVFDVLWTWITQGTLWPHLGATLQAMTLGYLAGCAGGIAIGLLLGFLPRVYQVFAPFIIAAFALPKIALAPLFIIFFGLGLAPKVVIVAVTVGFLVFQSTLDGIRSIEDDLKDTLLVMGASPFELATKLLIPGARPWIFSGMRISVRYAFTNTLLAELFSANAGIGYLIEAYSARFDLKGAYAAIIVLVLLSVILTELLTRIEERAQRKR